MHIRNTLKWKYNGDGRIAETKKMVIIIIIIIIIQVKWFGRVIHDMKIGPYSRCIVYSVYTRPRGFESPRTAVENIYTYTCICL